MLDFLTEEEIHAKYYQIFVIDHFLQEPFLLVNNVYCFSSLNVIFSATRLLPYPPINQPITLCCKWFPPAMRLLVWKLAIQPIFGLLLVFRHLRLSCELCRSSSASHGPIPWSSSFFSTIERGTAAGICNIPSMPEIWSTESGFRSNCKMRITVTGDGQGGPQEFEGSCRFVLLSKSLEKIVGS